MALLRRLAEGYSVDLLAYPTRDTLSPTQCTRCYKSIFWGVRYERIISDSSLKGEVKRRCFSVPNCSRGLVNNVPYKTLKICPCALQCPKRYGMNIEGKLLFQYFLLFARLHIHDQQAVVLLLCSDPCSSCHGG